MFKYKDIYPDIIRITKEAKMFVDETDTILKKLVEKMVNIDIHVMDIKLQYIP